MSQVYILSTETDPKQFVYEKLSESKENTVSYGLTHTRKNAYLFSELEADLVMKFFDRGLNIKKQSVVRVTFMNKVFECCARK